jgi:arylsulfatase A-like enzyme
VLLVVTDQLTYDALERTRPLLTGGLARLLERGASFADAHHAHAVTTTAPGHATLATGADPARHGIVGNSWTDRARGERVYCAWDPDREIYSPIQLRLPTLGDRLRERWPRSKVYAASGKDRAAVLLAGRRGHGAFWFDDGEWVTSDYYAPRGAPAWLAAFNGRDEPRRLLGELWEPLPVAPEAAAAAGVIPADYGAFDAGLPRAFGGFSPAADGGFSAAFEVSPFLDQQLAELARSLVEAEDLGADEWPDLLALSFSALDLVGHAYGPHSPEVLDVVLRLDRVLGELLDFLDREVGEDAVVVALSSDHGVAPLPELAGALGVPGRRAGRDDVVCLQRANLELGRRYGEGVDWLDRYLYLDAEALAEHRLDRAEVAEAAAGLLERCPGVARAWTWAELGSAQDAEAGGSATAGAGSYRDAYRRSFDPERSPDLLLEVRPYFVPVTTSAATHGSPHPYDTHVPLILAGPGVPAGEVAGRAHTSDLAPTLAVLLGLPPAAGLDGESLLPRLADAPGVAANHPAPGT